VFEAAVDGQEVECAAIGNQDGTSTATLPGEILAGAEFYTYDDKYKNGISQTLIPARLPAAKLAEVRDYAVKAYNALGCEGLARCDFFVERGTGRVLINEINTFPGFTSISMYPKLMEQDGLDAARLIDRLIALALERTAN
jgi:D-alanine-D-alanine ligase